MSSRTVTYGNATAVLAHAGTATLKIRPTRADRRMFAAGRAIRLLLTVRFTPSGASASGANTAGASTQRTRVTTRLPGARHP